MLRITTYCHFKTNQIFLNGELFFDGTGESNFRKFLVSVFKFAKIRYPKFYKMDEISKLGFLASELILANSENKLTGTNTGIVFSNRSSTLVTDATFQQSVNDYGNFFPSPSVFVYTLPNIMMGEISIRNKFNGENAFFIFDGFYAGFQTNYINRLFEADKIENCLGGWVEQSERNFEAFVYLAEPANNGLKHTPETVRELYEKLK